MTESTSRPSGRFSLTPQPMQDTIVRAEGCELITADGRRILDAAGGAVVSNIGHGRPEIADAVAEALRNLDYVAPFWATPNRVALSEHLVDRPRVGIGKDGRPRVIAANRADLSDGVPGHPGVAPADYTGSEWAGATFAPDGRTLFVNLQSPGVTLAITGPFEG